MLDHSDDGLVTFDYDCDELGVPLTCWFEYEAAEPQTYDEPGYPEMWTLMHVYLPGSSIDLAPVLDSSLMEQIEQWAADRGARAIQDAADEAAIDQYIASREDWS